MKLSNLLIGLNYQKINYIDVEIEKLSISTTDLAPNTLYFCIRGQNTDGHELASVAIAHGAVALVVDRKLDYDVPQILVEDVRQTVGILAGRFFKQPRDKFKLIGVTGTNGKTTTTYMLKSILETAGYKVGLIGTICNMIGEQKFPAHLTTPDPIELHKIFLQMADAGVDYVVMEVSAHAIALNKMAGVICDVGILTNITQDHLDFFHTFENYRDTKLAFLNKKYCTQAVANIDDNNICELIMQDITTAADKLIENANASGGYDNITVIIITHNTAIAPMADKIIQFKNGRAENIIINKEPKSIDDIEW